jgi:ParB/RepB/Spo0J family partition protein
MAVVSPTLSLPTRSHGIAGTEKRNDFMNDAIQTEEPSTTQDTMTVQNAGDESLSKNTEERSIATPQAPVQIHQISVDDVETDLDQPRMRFDAEKLQALADDIARHGIDLPLLVRRRPEDKAGEAPYQLIAGERRLRAARMAGLSHVPVILKEGLSDEAATLLQLHENLLREDLNPVEEARGLRRYKVVSQKTWEAVAAELGWAKQTVLWKSRLLEAPDEIQGMIIEGKMPPSYYQEISALPEEHQVELAQRVMTDGLKLQDLRKERDRLKRANKSKADSLDGEASADRPRSEQDERTFPPEESHGTVTNGATTLDSVRGTASDLRGDQESANDDASADKWMEGTEGQNHAVPSEATETVSGSGSTVAKEATKELRVALAAEIYARLEDRAKRHGKSITGFVRQLLSEAADAPISKDVKPAVDLEPVARLIAEKAPLLRSMRPAA